MMTPTQKWQDKGQTDVQSAEMLGRNILTILQEKKTTLPALLDTLSEYLWETDGKATIAEANAYLYRWIRES